jgi:hypothetical protein
MEGNKIDNRAPSSFGSGGKAGRENSFHAENDVSASNPGPIDLSAAPCDASPFETARLASAG